MPFQGLDELSHQGRLQSSVAAVLQVMSYLSSYSTVGEPFAMLAQALWG
jgi:hypothetical protein